jgi:hypothetical protein
LDIPSDVIRIPKKSLDEPAAAHVGQQIVGIVLGLQVPFFAFAVLGAEFAHLEKLLWMIGKRLVNSYQLSAFSYQLLAFSFWLLAFGFWLLKKDPKFLVPVFNLWE